SPWRRRHAFPGAGRDRHAVRRRTQPCDVVRRRPARRPAPHVVELRLFLQGPHRGGEVGLARRPVRQDSRRRCGIHPPARGPAVILKRGLTIVGMLLVLFGVFFALQGADIIHWPLESTMLGRGVWIRNGLALAIVGALLWLGARRIR